MTSQNQGASALIDQTVQALSGSPSDVSPTDGASVIDSWVTTLGSDSPVSDTLGELKQALQSSSPEAAGGACESISLHDFKGKNLILVFYPADWSAVCGDELAVFNEMLPLFQRFNADLIGISVDSVSSHGAFKKDRGFKMSLLADFEPKGEVARQYGVHHEKGGFCERALFAVDKDGIIRYSFVSPMDVNPGASELLKTLKQIRSNTSNPQG